MITLGLFGDASRRATARQRNYSSRPTDRPTQHAGGVLVTDDERDEMRRHAMARNPTIPGNQSFFAILLHFCRISFFRFRICQTVIEIIRLQLSSASCNRRAILQLSLTHSYTVQSKLSSCIYYFIHMLDDACKALSSSTLTISFSFLSPYVGCVISMFHIFKIVPFFSSTLKLLLYH